MVVRRRLERSRNLAAAFFSPLVILANPASGGPLIIPVKPEAIQLAPTKNQTQEPVSTLQMGDSEIKVDNTGKGAVLCIWSMLVAAANAAQKCGWEENAALGVAIGRIDVFIMANSPEPVTQEQLDARKAADTSLGDENASGPENMCEPTAGIHSFSAMLRRIHSTDAEELAALTSELLSIPREPVMNPCL